MLHFIAFPENDFFGLLLLQPNPKSISWNIEYRLNNTLENEESQETVVSLQNTNQLYNREDFVISCHVIKWRFFLKSR